jgi:hypothetical protein
MSQDQVEGYISKLDPSQSEIVSRVRQIILEIVPGVKESLKWGRPVYEMNGPMCYLKAHKNSVNFGFWRGVELEDPEGLLQGTGQKMRHVKLKEKMDIDRPAFKAFVRQAVALNQAGGDPTKGD